MAKYSVILLILISICGVSAPELTAEQKEQIFQEAIVSFFYGYEPLARQVIKKIHKRTIDALVENLDETQLRNLAANLINLRVSMIDLDPPTHIEFLKSLDKRLKNPKARVLDYEFEPLTAEQYLKTLFLHREIFAALGISMSSESKPTITQSTFSRSILRLARHTPTDFDAVITKIHTPGTRRLVNQGLYSAYRWLLVETDILDKGDFTDERLSSAWRKKDPDFKADKVLMWKPDPHCSIPPDKRTLANIRALIALGNFIQVKLVLKAITVLHPERLLDSDEVNKTLAVLKRALDKTNYIPPNEMGLARELHEQFSQIQSSCALELAATTQ